MIIFDLDGTLANCEHRRFFVDPSYRDDCYYHIPSTLKQMEGWYYKDVFKISEPPIPMKFIPNWESFYESCDKDELIIPVAEIYDRLWKQSDYYDDFEIWSGRCESIRKKTEKWLTKNEIPYSNLKMRPIGDNTPDDQLKERWLDIALGQGKTIDFVFDDRPKVVRMWRRRGIFVFDVNQNGNEF